MLNIFIAFIVGMVLVGSSIQRTLFVDRGQLFLALASSVVNSVSYAACITYIAKEDMASYVATSVGALVVVTYLVIQKQKEQNDAKS